MGTLLTKSLHERLLEHAEDSQKRMDQSHMAQHLRESHQEEWREMDLEHNGWRQFKVEVVKTNRSSFTRQLHEAVL